MKGGRAAGRTSAQGARELLNGRFRFDHISDGIHHDDRAYALAVVCHTLETGADAGLVLVLDVSAPPVAGEIWWPVDR